MRVMDEWKIPRHTAKQLARMHTPLAKTTISVSIGLELDRSWIKGENYFQAFFCGIADIDYVGNWLTQFGFSKFPHSYI